MKRVIFCILSLTSAVAACQQAAPVSDSTAKTQAAAAAPSQQTTPDPAEFDKQIALVQENLTKMQEQMDRLERTHDPQERQRLLQQHWETMRSAMATMHAMSGATMGCCAGGPARGPGKGGHGMGGPMMGGARGWAGARGYYSNLTPEQLRQRQYMTDRYLAMQQQMMNHMMWHQHWASQPPPARK